VKRLKLLFLAIAGSLLLMPVTVSAAFNPFADACSTGGSSGSAACQANGSDPLTGANGKITQATRLISYLAGIASIIIMIVAGIMYITSGGDPGKIGEARDAVVYAAVGLVIVVLAQGLILFVLNRV